MTTILRRPGRSTIWTFPPRIAAAGRILALAGLCVSLLTACPTDSVSFRPMPPGSPAGPQPMTNVGTIPGLPDVMGPFQREQVIAYRPGQRNFSVGYNMRAPGQLAVSTVYFYTVGATAPEFYRSLSGQFADASESLRNAHPGATLVVQSRGTATQGEAAIEGLSATYRYEELFAGRRRLLASEVYVFQIGDHFVKFRHSYPWEQRELVAPQIAELMRRLDWSDPAAVTTHLLSR